MPGWLLITLFALCGVSLLAWVVSVALPPLSRRSDGVHLFIRWMLTVAMALFLGWSFRRYGQTNTLLLLVHSMIGVALVLAVWGRHLAGFFAGPLTSMFDGGGERVKPEPLYSIAEARRKQGKIREAMYEIHTQLEKFPNDFRGQMLLAEIQAENANDVPGAEATIRRIISQPGHSSNHIASALTVLADWHLRFEQDVEAARACFAEIAQLFPETDLAQNAEQRIAHLAERAAVIESRERVIHLPSSEGMKLTPTVLSDAEIASNAEEEAARLVAHLTEFPQDNEAREDLAKVYLDKFGRLDLASEQMEQLIALPGQSPRQTARWLNLLADFQVRCGRDIELAATTVQRIIDLFPNHSSAEIARQRLGSLNQEFKRYDQPRIVPATKSGG